MKQLFAWGCLLGCASLAWAQHTEHHHHGAHVHGHAQMNIVLDNDQVFIELVSPMANLVGFEHTPKRAEEKKAWIEARTYLEKTEGIVEFEGGNCKLEETELHDPFAEHSYDYSHNHGHNHKDLVVNWLYRCDEPMARALKVILLQHFNAIKHLDVNWITEQGQGVQLVTPERIQISFQ